MGASYLSIQALLATLFSLLCIISTVGASCPAALKLNSAIEACIDIEDIEVTRFDVRSNMGLLDEEDLDKMGITEKCDSCEAAIAADLKSAGLDMYDEASLEDCYDILEQSFAQSGLSVDVVQVCYDKAAEIERQVQEVKDYQKRTQSDIEYNEEYARWQRETDRKRMREQEEAPKEAPFLQRILFPSTDELKCSALFGAALAVLTHYLPQLCTPTSSKKA